MDRRHDKKILDILIKGGVLTKERAHGILSAEGTTRERIEALGIRKRGRIQSDVSIVDVLCAQNTLSSATEKLITEEEAMRVIATHLGMPFVKIDPLKLDSDVVTMGISKPYAIKHQIVPLELNDGVLTVVTSNPFDNTGIEGIKQSLDYSIQLAVATKTDIEKIINDFFGFKSSVRSAQQDLTSHTDISNLEQYVKLKSSAELDSSDSHVVKAVEYVLHYAYEQRASDIHIEPKRNESLVRFRIDGILMNIHKMPKSVHPAFISRIKGLSRMDIAEKRKPQDGRIKTEHNGKEIELRVSTLPVAFGEKIVIRIFDPDILMQDLSDLGFHEREFKLYKSFIEAPHGLILVTGPTGSGKTSTLYSSLKSISSPDVNISTIEDPVEMVYEHFNQTSIQPQIGITFASTLKTLLRQDPDIIMIGEIRDYDTADNAVQASLTGHLVMSTLHTNDAPTSIARLIDLGIAPFLINASLTGIIAQRLVRKVCPHCTEAYFLSDNEVMILDLGNLQSVQREVALGKGCPECRGTGYLGRTGIFEVLPITEEIRKAVISNSSPDRILEIAIKEGFSTLKQNVTQKLLKKITSFEEVVRVLGL